MNAVSHSCQHIFYQRSVIPQPPSAPDFTSSAKAFAEVASGAAQKDAQAAAQAPDAGGETSTKSTSSIGMSPVVQAFLLQLQELGLSSISGTDGNDKLNGWSNSLVDGGDGDDTVNVWSGSVVDSGAGNDSIKAWSESEVHGGAGNDRIDVWSDSTVDAGDGDDVVRAWSDTSVYGGAGNDRLSAWSDSIVDGGDGADQISVWAGSIARGGAGNDSIYASTDTDITGGAGDDLISVGSNSIVNFDAGDGKDTIYADRGTVVKFGAGITPDNTHVTMSGSTATITFDGSDDQITVQLGWRGAATLSFADGTSTEIESPIAKILREGVPVQAGHRVAVTVVQQGQASIS